MKSKRIKKVKNNSLTRQLNRIIFTLTACIFITSTIISFIYQNKQITEHIEKESDYVVDKDMALLENEINRYIMDVEKVAIDERVRSLNWEVQKPFLEESAKKYGFPSMSFTGVDGILRSTSGAEINVKDSPPYKAFMAGQTVISDPMVS